MRDINNAIIFLSKYIILKIIVDKVFDKRSIIDKLQRQVYIINKLKINMLLKFDILSFEKIIINYHRKIFILYCCRKIIVTIIIVSAKQKINRMI